MSNFKHPTGPKIGVINIASLDRGIQVNAQYNPKELEVKKTVPWQKNPQSNKSPEKGIQLEFTGAEGRTMSIELLFDGYEQKESVQDTVEKLNTMASPLEPGSTDENLRRPHRCVVTWGETVPGFRCVIDSLSTKYTMFSEQGEPLRATCTVSLKEADVVSMAKSDGDGGSTTSGTSTGGKK